MTDRNLWGLRATQYQASLHQPPLALVWWNISVFMDSEFLALPPSWVSWCLTRQLADFSTTIQLLEVFVSAISDGCRHWENMIHTNDNSQISSNLLIYQSRMPPASSSHTAPISFDILRGSEISTTFGIISQTKHFISLHYPIWAVSHSKSGVLMASDYWLFFHFLIR